MSGRVAARTGRRLGATPVVARWTGAADGDQRPAVEGGVRPSFLPPGHLVVGVRQVHGARVAVVREDPASAAGAVEADAVVTDRPDVCAAVLVADCAPVALATPTGVLAAVLAGWRGLVAGVLEAAVTAVRELAGVEDVVAALGPCIGACCYAFSPGDLDVVASRLGDTVRAATRGGEPALSVDRAVAVALARVGVTLDWRSGRCTSCDPGWFSARSRAETERQAVYVWRDR